MNPPVIVLEVCAYTQVLELRYVTKVCTYSFSKSNSEETATVDWTLGQSGTVFEADLGRAPRQSVLA